MALRVTALLREGIQYVLLLDLAKSYNTASEMLLIEKLKMFVSIKFMNQLKVFITTVVVQVVDYRNNTFISMIRSLTKGRISSHPFLKVLINYLAPELKIVL